MSKTPNGFRAVRYCDSQRIYYVIEQEDGCFKAVSDDGARAFIVEPKAFKVTFCHEHRPEMPPAVRARFEGKPTLSEWWEAKNKENAE